MAERTYYTAEKKLEVVMKILRDGKKISEVAEEYEIHPNLIMDWQKQFLEGAASVFKVTREDVTAKSQQRELNELKAEISRKDSVIAQLATENLELKKNLSGQTSRK